MECKLAVLHRWADTCILGYRSVQYPAYPPGATAGSGFAHHATACMHVIRIACGIAQQDNRPSFCIDPRRPTIVFGQIPEAGPERMVWHGYRKKGGLESLPLKRQIVFSRLAPGNSVKQAENWLDSGSKYQGK